MKSNFLTLNKRDLFKGLIIAIITAALSGIYQIIQTNSPLNWTSVKPILAGTVIAVISYLLKNFATNSKGEFMTAERT